MLNRYKHFFAALLCIPIITYYAFGLTKDIDPAILTQYDSAILDMDYVRVVDDWTSYGTDTRDALFHPLYKLFMVPQLALVRAILSSGDAITAARVLAIGYMVAFCLSVATLSFHVTSKRYISLYYVSLLIALSSFTVMLFCGVPDTSLISGLATLIPYLLLIRVKDNQFTYLECAAWAFSAVFGLGLTLTQVVHTFIAFTFRARWAQGSLQTKRKYLISFLLLCIFSFAGLKVLQSVFFPTIRIDGSSLRFEGNFFSLKKLLSAPHILDTVTQCIIYPFVAPGSKYSPWYFNQFGGGYYLVSMAPVRWAHVWVLAFLGGVIAAASWKPAALSGRAGEKDPLVPMLFSVLAMVCLHVLYGREFIMYSSNWHGLVIVIIVTVFVRAQATIRENSIRVTVKLLVIIVICLTWYNNIAAICQAYSLADPKQIHVKRIWDNASP